MKEKKIIWSSQLPLKNRAKIHQNFIIKISIFSFNQTKKENLLMMMAKICIHPNNLPPMKITLKFRNRNLERNQNWNKFPNILKKIVNIENRKVLYLLPWINPTKLFLKFLYKLRSKCMYLCLLRFQLRFILRKKSSGMRRRSFMLKNLAVMRLFKWCQYKFQSK